MTSRRKNAISTARSEKSPALPATKCSCAARTSGKTDLVVKAHTERTARNVPSEAHLRQSKREYQETLVRELFDFGAINNHLQGLRRLLFQEHSIALSAEGLLQFNTLVAKTGAE